MILNISYAALAGEVKPTSRLTKPTIRRTTPTEADIVSTARTIIVGAGLAGLRVAEKLRTRGYDGAITLIGAEDRPPYDRPPLSKSVLLAEPGTPVAPLRTPDRLDELAIDLRLGTAATGVDTATRTVLLADGNREPYTHLVIATGARARELPGVTNTPGVLTLRTAGDAQRLRDALRSVPHVTVLGAGFLGLEVAASARRLDVPVTVLEARPAPLSAVLNPELATLVADLHTERGVDLRCGTGLAGLKPHGSGLSLTLTDGSTLTSGLLLVAIGARPNTEWLVQSDIPLDDGVVVDACGRSGVDGIYAVGDAARFTPADGAARGNRYEHWDHAGETAAVVAATIAGSPVPLSAPPYFWSDHYEFKLQSLGTTGPADELVVVEGSLAERRFLSLHVRSGVVVGVSSIGRPAELNRCRSLLAAAPSLAAAREQAPWVRRLRPAGSTTTLVQ
jgi:3-phenylpropionate/trans-cinnamate dioxygenase ferredoxin reductase component